MTLTHQGQIEDGAGGIGAVLSALYVYVYACDIYVLYHACDIYVLYHGVPRRCGR